MAQERRRPAVKSRAQRRAKLREKIAGKMKLEFRHAGATCPMCGYVFDKGFSGYYVEGTSSLGSAPETLTLCTRCRRALAVHNDTGAIRVLDETAQLLLTSDDRAALDVLREMLEVAGYNDLA